MGSRFSGLGASLILCQLFWKWPLMCVLLSGYLKALVLLAIIGPSSICFSLCWSIRIVILFRTFPRSCRVDIKVILFAIWCHVNNYDVTDSAPFNNLFTLFLFSHSELLPSLIAKTLKEEGVLGSNVLIEWSRLGSKTAVLERLRFSEIKFYRPRVINFADHVLIFHVF